MASLEFEDYALLWWEQVQIIHEENGDAPIDSWEDMKREMRARFVPLHYTCDLFKETTRTQGRHQVRRRVLQRNGNVHDACKCRRIR